MGPGNGHVALRTCVGCRTVKPVDFLVRCAATHHGDLLIDRQAPGRGVWLCPNSPSCLANALRRKAFSRTLRRPVSEASLAEFAARFSVTGIVLVRE
jgi:uncharacterized protein